MFILERLRRCKYCGSDMTDKYSPEGYASNPFCDDCFNERVQKGALPRKGRFVLIGKYFHFVPDGTTSDRHA